MRSARTSLAAVAWLYVTAIPLTAQQAGRPGGCTLVMEPTGQTESVSLRVSGEDNAYITHVWGGMRWTCGTATMTADSAVRYDLERRVEMFGRVRYRDTIRTLESRRLDFFEENDRMVASGDVVLTRIASGSTLRGPTATFIRAVSGIAERTTATGRPHVLLLPEPEREGKPVDVDADRVDMLGERAAWAWGDVFIQRPDVQAESDSAFFDMEEGTGVLYGAARAEQPDLVLEGDSIRLHFSDGELERVLALGSGRAVGEQFEIRSELIDARLVANDLDEVWAYGAGRTLATSSPYVLAADSLRVAATAGRLDSIIAVGQSSAVEVEEADLSAGEPVRTTRDRSWVAGDTLFIVFEAEAAEAAVEPVTGEPEVEPREPEAAPDQPDRPTLDEPDAETPSPAAAPADSAVEQKIERLLAIGSARSFYLVRNEADEGGEPSRNYLIGARIEVEFREGKAQRVSADRAVGIYLEPGEPGERPGVPEPGEDDPGADEPSSDREDEGGGDS